MNVQSAVEISKLAQDSLDSLYELGLPLRFEVCMNLIYFLLLAALTSLVDGLGAQVHGMPALYVLFCVQLFGKHKFSERREIKLFHGAPEKCRMTSKIPSACR